MSPLHANSPVTQPATRRAYRRRCNEPGVAAPEIAPAPATPVLHCGPFPQRGKPLQFHDFDESYLERLRAGDFRTQEHFSAYFGALIQIKLRSRLKSREAMEDIRQETFTRFFVALRDGRILQPARLGPYVNSICNNVLLEHYRSSARHVPMEEEAQENVPAKGDLLGFLTMRQNEKNVRCVLEQLPERDRRLLKEIFLEERDKDEVCRDFGVDREYLRVLLHRAKRSFKLLYLKSQGDNPPEFAQV
jgi:RNA polymerase sigma-70 factor, ECF subfamily